MHNHFCEFDKRMFGIHDLKAIKIDYVNFLIPEALKIRLKLIEFIREESGANLVDKKIMDFVESLSSKKTFQRI